MAAISITYPQFPQTDWAIGSTLPELSTLVPETISLVSHSPLPHIGELRLTPGIDPFFKLVSLLVTERHNQYSPSPLASLPCPPNSRAVCCTVQRKNSFTFDSTVDHEAKLGLSVMVTFTVPPSILYLPSTPLPEKLPDVASPLKVALFSFAIFLASETSVLGFFVAFMLKVRPSPPPPPPPLAVEEVWVFLPVEGYPVPREDLRGRRLGPLPFRAPFTISTAPPRCDDPRLKNRCSFLYRFFGWCYALPLRGAHHLL